jgi:hypothetical protein
MEIDLRFGTFKKFQLSVFKLNFTAFFYSIYDTIQTLKLQQK